MCVYKIKCIYLYMCIYIYSFVPSSLVCSANGRGMRQGVATIGQGQFLWCSFVGGARSQMVVDGFKQREPVV